MRLQLRANDSNYGRKLASFLGQMLHSLPLPAYTGTVLLYPSREASHVTDRSDLTAPGTPDETAATDELETNEPSCPRTGAQLILIPLAVVIVLVTAGLTVGWLVSPSVNPSEIIRDLGTEHRGNWRKALVLANMLRDPEHTQLRRDDGMARQLSSLLDAELEAARMDKDHIQLRVFLCRALGEFETQEGLPMLIRAGRTQRDAAELVVRRSAVEAVTVLASRLDPKTVRDNRELTEMALTASEAFENDDGQWRSNAELRGSAAFLLGVLGGQAALDRLVELLQDPTPDVRFNAATGLARYGRVEAIGVLREMLDPDNADAIAGERSAEGRQWKRALVVTNAMQAVDQLALQAPARELDPLIQSLDQLARADVSRPVQVQARQKLQALKALQAD